jgi:transposase-like protein
VPETIPIDGTAANAAAIKSDNAAHGTAMAIRTIKYLNNMVEQDHRAGKRDTRPMLGFKAFTAAEDPFVGIELRHMIKKKQMVMEAGEEGLTAAEQFYSLAA